MPRQAAPGPASVAPRLAARIPVLPLTLFLALLLAAFPVLPAAAQERGARVLFVNDGDTLTLGLGGRREIVRLLGIDAPETMRSHKISRAAARAGRSPEEEAALGEKAKARLAELAPPGTILGLAQDPGAPERDAHGRLLAYLRLPDGRLLNAIMLEEGWAVVFRRCGCGALKEFTGIERQARTRRLGLWGGGGR